MKLEFIPLWDVDEHWNEVAPLLAKAIAKQSAVNLESVYRDCKGGKFLLWRAARKAAFVTEIQTFPCIKVCMVILCGGEDMEEWYQEAKATLKRHAKALGCSKLMQVGRRGWARDQDFKITDVVMEMEL